MRCARAFGFLLIYVHGYLLSQKLLTVTLEVVLLCTVLNVINFLVEVITNELRI